MFETVVEYFDNSQCRVYTNKHKLINRLFTYFNENPDEVKILSRPEDNDGYLNAYFPKSWLRIKPKKQRQLTDEERQILKDRFLKGKKAKQSA